MSFLSLNFKTTALLFIFTLFLSISVAFAADPIPYDWTQSQYTPEPEAFKPHREKVFYHHLRFLLTQRLEALNTCARIYPNAKTAQKVQDYANTMAFYMTEPTTLEERHVIKLLELLQDSEKWNSYAFCRVTISNKENALFNRERAKFKSLVRKGKKLCKVVEYGCSSMTDCSGYIDMLAQLDPYCRVPQEVSTNLKGDVESNPCFAGDEKVFGSVYSNPVFNYETVRGKMKTFIDRFYEAMINAKDGATLDWWDFFEYDHDHDSSLEYSEQREFFMGMLTLLYSASKTELGYVDGFGDLLWKKLLFIDKKSPDEVFKAYTEFRQTVDLFRAIEAWAVKRNIAFVIMNAGNYALVTLPRDINHHDFMAAYLACTLRPKYDREVAELIPEVMGLGYEAMDYVSHRKEGLSHKASMDNFKRDTHRYVEGAEWGYNFCVPF